MKTSVMTERTTPYNIKEKKEKNATYRSLIRAELADELYEKILNIIVIEKRYRNKEFWCRGYYVDTVGKNESRIAEYIKNQLKEDELGEQLAIPSANPFTGSK